MTSGMQSNSFEYKTLQGDSILIKYDHSAVTTGGGGQTDEPAWSFRLWNGSIYLSRYLESIASSLHGENVIDLGSGTGLTSIVLGKCCQTNKVYATDLSHALPLLNYNIEENMRSPDALHFRDSDSDRSQLPLCPASHSLSQVTADCEDYMCNVCDFDIDENSCIHRCVECNFDICAKCVSKIAAGDMSSFPEWFRLQLQLQQSKSSNHRGGGRVVPLVYDWSSTDSLAQLKTEVAGEEEVEGVKRGVKFLVGADVTYSPRSIDLFFAAAGALAPTLCPGAVLLFAHHNRSEETNQYMLQQLEKQFGGSYKEVDVSVESMALEGGGTEGNGEMKMFKVSLNL